MLNLFGKKDDQQEPKQNYNNPTWLRWTVFLFMAYAAYTVYKQGPDGMQMNSTKAISPHVFETANGVVPNSAAPQRLNQETVNTIYQIGGEVQGGGDSAACGQSAQVRAEAFLMDGTVFTALGLPTTAQPITIGAKTGWQNAVTGMRVGGVREAFVPIKDVVDEATRKKHQLAEDALIRFKLNLDNLEPSTPAGSLGFQTIDLMPGTGAIAACGDSVMAHVEVWGGDGLLLYSTRKGASPTALKFTIGKVPYFYGLDRAILDQHAGGARRAIVTPAYLKAPKDTAAPTDATAKGLVDAISKGTTIIMDVHLISVEKAEK